MVSSDAFEEANQRGAALQQGPCATAARYDRRIARVVVSLTTGIDVSFRPQMAQGLENAKPAQLSEIQISPSGLGLHFPQLDADLYLPALLEGWLGSKQWSAAEMGARGGRVKSTAKAESARANGQRGGRPRKAVKG